MALSPSGLAGAGGAFGPASINQRTHLGRPDSIFTSRVVVLPLAVDHGNTARPIGDALAMLGDRHPALRSTVHWSDHLGWMQVELLSVPIETTAIKQSHAASLCCRDSMTRWAYRPFELDGGPLTRIGVWEATAESLIVIAADHLMTDGISCDVMARDLDALLLCRERELPTLPGSSIEAAVAEAQASESHLLTDQWWERRYAGVTAPLSRISLPPSHESQLKHSGSESVRRSRSVVVALDASAAAALCALSEDRRVPQFASYFASFRLLIGSDIGLDELDILVPFAGRTPESWEAVGWFAHTLPVRTGVDGRESFGTLVQLVRDSVANALEHSSLPFAATGPGARSARAVGLAGSPLRFDLTDARRPARGERLRCLRPVPFGFAPWYPNLSAHVRLEPGAAILELECGEEFASGAVKSLANRWGRLAKACARRPEDPIDEILDAFASEDAILTAASPD